jgi:hypothetical protein
MIRLPEYAILWKNLQDLRASPVGDDNRRGFLIVGHPGIGKTLLLDLLLSWSLKTSPQLPVITIAVEGVSVFLNPDGKTPKRYEIDLKALFNREFVTQFTRLGAKKAEEILVLHDIKTAYTLPWQGALLEYLAANFKVTCVVSASPTESNFKDFKKDFCQLLFRTHVLPTLSYDEANEFVQRFCPAIHNFLTPITKLVVFADI